MTQRTRSFVFILLGAITILATVLRFYQLGSVPVSLYWDETADAYNAYSIAKTFHDEHAHGMPILFQSFDDYKMPGMVYMMAISIHFFGLNEFATRLPMALVGILMVVATYFLVREIVSLEVFETMFSLKRRVVIESIALLSSFLLAISPWHLQFSRTGYEASVGIACIVCGMIFFFRSFHHPKLLFIASFFLGISFYFYRSIFIFLPVFLLSVFFIFKKDIVSKIPVRILVASIFLGIAIASPIILAVFTPPGNSRANDVSIFTNSKNQISLHELWAIQSGNGYLGNLFYNKRIVFLKEILDNYSVHFSPQFLFLYGDPNPRQSTRDMGVLYLWEIVFIPLGIAAVVIHFKKKMKGTLFSWILAAPLPAAIAINNPHALRSLNMLPMPQIISAIGLVFGFSLCRRWVRPFYLVGTATLVLFFFASYLFNYYTTSKYLSANDWGDGYKQMNLYLLAHQHEYDTIIISGHYWKPYVYTLFYTKYDPVAFQQFGNQYQFGKFIFGGTSWEQQGPPELGSVDLSKMADGKKALVALSPEEYRDQRPNIKLQTEIKDTTEKTVFIIGELPAKPIHETFK